MNVGFVVAVCSHKDFLVRLNGKKEMKISRTGTVLIELLKMERIITNSARTVHKVKCFHPADLSGINVRMCFTLLFNSLRMKSVPL